MITTEQKEAFKKVLGNRYTAKVKIVLKQKKIKNRNGKAHSSAMITNVINGEFSHAIIEDAIIEAVEFELKENKKAERKKEKLLNLI